MNTIQFDKKVKCGNDYVSVQIIQNCDDLKVGNIFLLGKTASNSRLAFCKVKDIGVNAKDKTGCNVGDYVMIDRLATFAHTSPIACLKYDSVICLTNKENNDYFPLKDMLFVEPQQKESVSNVGGIYVSNYGDRLNIGKITKLNFEKNEKYPFEVGQNVILTKGSDVVEFGNVTVYIYKKDMIVCSIEENV